MTYVLVEHARVVQPTDRDEAERWAWDRVCVHRMRGRYWCRYTGEPVYGCPAPMRQCCELGERRVRPGWRRYTVTAHAGGNARASTRDSATVSVHFPVRSPSGTSLV